MGKGQNPVMPQVIVLERTIWRAPLGLRFIDLARGTRVNDEMVVMAWPVGGKEPKLSALRSPLTGVYGFRSLPGLRPYEVGEKPASDWCNTTPGSAKPNFIITIEDTLQRFLPQTVLLCLPKERLLEVPLFSAPARSALPGYGLVQGEIWDQVKDKAAGWAMVTARTDSTTYAAVADGRGMFALFVPYAGGLPALVGSPPYGSIPLERVSWPLTIQVFYKATELEYVQDLRPPEIHSILQQPPAQIMNTPTNQLSSINRQLSLDQNLVVTTQGSPRLLIVPA
jgi:hypothetical protein